MEQTSAELSSALMRWTNTFAVTPPIRSWKDAADGRAIWQILGYIDDERFHGSLPEAVGTTSDNWIPRWQNWKHIEKEVLWYIKEECGKLPSLGRVIHADLKAIATDSSTQEILKVVKCVLLAAMYSDKSNEQMVEVMSSLGPKVAQPIAAFLGEMEELDQTMTQPDDEDLLSDSDASQKADDRQPVIERDLELEKESRLIQALQDKKRVEARLADALADLEEMKVMSDALQTELDESKYALDRNRGIGVSSRNVAQLTQRADQDRDYIEKLETDLSEANVALDNKSRQIERLELDVKSIQVLRDELQVATSERNELRQKAKANENLKKKIQILQEQDRATQMLRHDLQTAQEQLQEIEALRDRCQALEKANDENAQTIANGEQEIFDQKTAKRMLEHELQSISHKWEQSKELLANAQETIRDMEDRLDDGGAIVQDHSHLQLDAELEPDNTASSAQRRTVQTRQGFTATADAIILQQKLSISGAAVERLEKRCLDLLRENLGFKSSMDDKDAEASDDVLSFQQQTRRLEELIQELDATKAQYVHVTDQASVLQKRLEAAGLQANLNDEALSLRNTYAADLEQTINDQRSLLRHALLSTEVLQKEDATTRANVEWQMWKHQLEIINQASKSEAQSLVKTAASNITDRLEGLRGSVSAREAMLKDRDDELDRLQSEFSRLKLQSVPDLPRESANTKELQKQLRQLQRENQLVASAWYDLTTRLQSSNIHLSRRAESGRSWLSKMRAAVNTTTVVDRPS